MMTDERGRLALFGVSPYPEAASTLGRDAVDKCISLVCVVGESAALRWSALVLSLLGTSLAAARCDAHLPVPPTSTVVLHGSLC